MIVGLTIYDSSGNFETELFQDGSVNSGMTVAPDRFYCAASQQLLQKLFPVPLGSRW